jgi:hypothetical protein
MSRRLLEELHGTGSIYAGDELLRTARYHLSVWGPSTPSQTHDATSVVGVDGQVDITGIGEAVVLAGPGTLTLVLEDGRRLPFTLVASSGRLVGTGPLAPAG